MNKYIYLLCYCLFATFSSFAKGLIKEIKKVDDGLYMMYYDTTAQKHVVTKSTVVEFKKFIVLIEMPVTNDGGGSEVSEHEAGGEEVLQALKDKFPHKPLKYVLSTHWHGHSISSIKPFITRGITVVTTQKNFSILKKMVDSNTYAQYGKYIHFVGDEGMTIEDKTNEITAYRLDKKDYPNIPSGDFLFFYMPRYNCLHNSCMFQRFSTARAMGKELVSSRVDDLAAFVRAHNMNPRYIVTTDTYWDDATGTVPGDTLRKMLSTGITMGTLENQVIAIDETTMLTKTDSVLKYLMDNMIPYSVLNSAVYNRLRHKDFSKALAIARLQALINPSNPNVWDTYGEVYYFMGELKLAKKYEQQSKRIDKEFTQGGEATWKRDLETYKADWDN